MLTKTAARSAVWWILVALWAAVIFSFSAQDADASSALSNAVIDWLIAVFRIDISASAPAPDFSLSEIIRSLAHFSCFGILGVLTASAVRSHRVAEHRCLWIPFVICVGYAVTDEIHQWFVPGRSTQLSDVLVDSLGAALGILAVALIVLIARKAKHRASQRSLV